MEEKWVEISGTGSVYFISNFGRVKSNLFVTQDKNGRVVHHSGKMLSPVDNGSGYKKVKIKENGKSVDCMFIV
jgi:hypothetical protein